jgi:hypothetical protein
VIVEKCGENLSNELVNSPKEGKVVAKMAVKNKKAFTKRIFIFKKNRLVAAEPNNRAPNPTAIPF